MHNNKAQYWAFSFWYVVHLCSTSVVHIHEYTKQKPHLESESFTLYIKDNIFARSSILKWKWVFDIYQFQFDFLKHKKANFPTYFLAKSLQKHGFSPIMTNNPNAPGLTTSGGFIEVNNCQLWGSTAHKVAESTFVPLPPSLLNWSTVQW